MHSNISTHAVTYIKCTQNAQQHQESPKDVQ